MASNQSFTEVNVGLSNGSILRKYVQVKDVYWNCSIYKYHAITMLKGDVKSVLRRPIFQWSGPDHWNVVNISHLPNFLELNL